MNTQEILKPLADLTASSFDALLVPMSDLVNNGAIVLGIIGLFIWLRMQMKYNKQAEKEGSIM